MFFDVVRHFFDDFIRLWYEHLDWVWSVNRSFHLIRNLLDDIVGLWNFDCVFLNFLNLDWVLLDHLIGLRHVDLNFIGNL